MSTIESVLRKHIDNVRPAGAGTIRAKCPFHESKSSHRSLLVNLSTGWFRCFGCDARGRVSNLLERLGVEAESALEGVEFKSFNKDQFIKEVNTYHILPEAVLDCYDKPSSKDVKEHLNGFTPDFLAEHDVRIDRARRRILFFVRDRRGALVGCSGRTMVKGKEPRYLVYRDEFANIVPGYQFRNRIHLYGLHDWGGEHLESDEDAPLILVEGFKGCLWLKSLSNKINVAAVMGSGLTYAQKHILLSGDYKAPFYIFFDYESGHQVPNERGACHAYSAANALWREAQNSQRVKVVGSEKNFSLICQYPEDAKAGISPDDLTKPQIKEAVGRAFSPLEYSMKYHLLGDSSE